MRTRAQAALKSLLKATGSGIADGINVSNSGAMHLLDPLAPSLPPAFLPDAKPTCNAELSGADARLVVEKMLQTLVTSSAERIAPHVQVIQAAQAAAQPADPLALHARNAAKHKPTKPVPLDEVRPPSRCSPTHRVCQFRPVPNASLALLLVAKLLCTCHSVRTQAKGLDTHVCACRRCIRTCNRSWHAPTSHPHC